MSFGVVSHISLRCIQATPMFSTFPLYFYFLTFSEDRLYLSPHLRLSLRSSLSLGFYRFALVRFANSAPRKNLDDPQIRSSQGSETCF